MPTTPTSIVNRIMGVEAFTDALSLPAGTTIGGSTVDAANTIVNATGASLAITAALHNGKIVTINRATGVAVTLPNATGTGNNYRFFVGTTMSGGSTTITRGTTLDVMSGVVLQAKAATAMTPIPTAANSNTITLNGGTTGGILGDWIQLIDVATNQWFLLMIISSTGAIATPLSNT